MRKRDLPAKNVDTASRSSESSGSFETSEATAFEPLEERRLRGIYYECEDSPMHRRDEPTLNSCEQLHHTALSGFLEERNCSSLEAGASTRRLVPTRDGVGRNRATSTPTPHPSPHPRFVVNDLISLHCTRVYFSNCDGSTDNLFSTKASELDVFFVCFFERSSFFVNATIH